MREDDNEDLVSRSRYQARYLLEKNQLLADSTADATGTDGTSRVGSEISASETVTQAKVASAAGARRRIRPLLAISFLLLSLLYLAQLGGYPFQEPDESRYAEIPREMIEAGDWLTPRLNYVKYYEKPPLLYWLVGGTFQAFGMTEGVARLVPAFFAIATVLLTFALGSSMFGTRAGWIAAGLLATSPLFFALGISVLIDMPLTFFMTLTLAGYWWAQQADDAKTRTRWILVLAVSAGLGVLAKGLVALLLPGGIALAHLLAQRDWSTLRALVDWRPITLFLLIVLPWFLLVGAAHEEFLYHLIYKEHFERFAADVGHPEGPLYYLPVLALGPLPWTLLATLMGTSRAARGAIFEIPRPARIYLLLWAASVLVFFSVASSKLATYILPAFPALAMLFGAWLDKAIDSAGETIERACFGTATLLGGFGIAVLLAGMAGSMRPEEVGTLVSLSVAEIEAIAAPLVWLGAVFLLVGLLATTTRFRPRRSFAFLVLLVLGMGAGLFVATPGREVVRNARSVGQAIKAHEQPGDLVAMYRDFPQGVLYYAGLRVVQIDTVSEVEPGAENATDRDEYFWRGTGRLLDEWSSGRRVFLVGRSRRLAPLLRELDPTPRLFADNPHWSLVVNFPEGEGIVPEAR